jgi:hypothetical protein
MRWQGFKRDRRNVEFYFACRWEMGKRPRKEERKGEKWGGMPVAKCRKQQKKPNKAYTNSVNIWLLEMDGVYLSSKFIIGLVS